MFSNVSFVLSGVQSYVNILLHYQSLHPRGYDCPYRLWFTQDMGTSQVQWRAIQSNIPAKSIAFVECLGLYQVYISRELSRVNFQGCFVAFGYIVKCACCHPSGFGHNNKADFIVLPNPR